MLGKLVSSINHIYKKNNLYLYLGTVLLFFPMYNSENVNGTGLGIVYNIPVWIVATIFITAGLFLFANKKQLTVPTLYGYFLIFPIIILITGLVNEVEQPIAWLFRVTYILGGVLFLFSLFQFKISEKTISHCLFILILATGLHALIGMLQINIPWLLPPWIEQQSDNVPRGFFQQINVQASFLATGLIIILYCISRPFFCYSSMFTKIIVVISFSLAVYIIISSGSRIGALSMLLTIPLVLWSRKKQLLSHKKLLLVLFIFSCSAVFLGLSGVDKTIDKTAQLTTNTYSSARLSIYTIGTELVSQKPIYGYGVGGFLRAWNNQSTNFFKRHPNAKMPGYLTHPHNELLFWMIEGGLLSLFGLLAVIVGLGIALYRIGFQRGGAYAAMLLPISLHTQVELPFYISAIHWFLWLFLVFLILRHQSKTIKVPLSLSGVNLVRSVAVCLTLGVTLFMINSFQAQTELKNFLSDKNNQQALTLKIALNNLYFRPYTELIIMQSMLKSAVINKDTEKVLLYEKWAKEQVERNPGLNLYIGLFVASDFLRPKEKGCDAVKAGLAMYAHYEAFQKAKLACVKNTVN